MSLHDRLYLQCPADHTNVCHIGRKGDIPNFVLVEGLPSRQLIINLITPSFLVSLLSTRLAVNSDSRTNRFSDNVGLVMISKP